MAGYIVADIDVLDPQRYEEYKALGTLATKKFGGEYIVRGGEMKVLEGEWTPARVAIIKFDSLETALAWYNSPDYKKAIQARKGASNTRMIAVKGND